MCSRCTQKGHDYRRCASYAVETCLLCNMSGHSAKFCPDLWRRYHLTTSLGRIIKGKQRTSNSSIFCYNCGFEGHYGAECQRPRIDSWCLPTWTSVLSYDTPIGNTRNKVEDGRKKRVKYYSKEKTRDKNINFPSKRKKQPIFAQDPSSQHKIKKEVKPKVSPKESFTSKVSPKESFTNKVSPKEKNKVGKEVYFPRTPKTTASTSADMAVCNGNIAGFLGTLSRKQLNKLKRRPNNGTPKDKISDYLRTLTGRQLNKIRRQPKEKKFKAKQKEHREGLQQRLGLRITES
ncbi:zinc finger CCHC domain-containing protein 7 [Trichonephila clavata]|uniref:Zinc finger CCHC domain-containing protein 7 n=1 Tax=Trichonephila clavata TaxID=2740835 RepID=A0A8X6HY32_TRICU|nr:zinc finger CCHC domain-containing protein 7 [Trichonephila clavata]